MNSCRSIEFSACAPPLITFIIGTGSVAASSPPRCAEERDALLGRARLRRARARRRGSRSRRAGPCSACRRARSARGRAPAWSAASTPAHRAGDLAVHVRDRLRDALAAARRAAVAQLDRLVHAGRRAGRDDRAARARPTRAARRPRRSGCRASRGPGGRGRRRSAHRSSPLPGRSSASCASSGELASSPRRPRRRAARPRSTRARKRCRRRAQLELGIDVQPPRDVDRREQHVAELRRDARVGLGLGRGSPRGSSARSSRSSSSRSASAPREVRVVEADRRRAPLHLARVEQRRAAPRARRGRRPRAPPARA